MSSFEDRFNALVKDMKELAAKHPCVAVTNPGKLKAADVMLGLPRELKRGELMMVVGGQRREPKTMLTHDLAMKHGFKIMPLEMSERYVQSRLNPPEESENV